MLKNLKKVVNKGKIKSKEPKKYAKNGRFFTPEGRFLRNSEKRPCASLGFNPKKLYTKFHKNPL